MTRTKRVTRGKAYLPKVTLPDLEEMHRREASGKSRDRLQAAVLRKHGKNLEEIAKIVGRDISTVSRWLCRLEREGTESRHDRKSPGRPRKLNAEQERSIEEDLDKPPGESNFTRGSWNAKMVATRIRDRFGISCSQRTALRVAHRVGFSVRKPRSVPYNCVSSEAQDVFIKKMDGIRARWKEENRAPMAGDAASLQDSPTSRRGLRRKGGKDTVSTNYSKKSIHLIGVLGDGTLDLQFHENLKAENYVAAFEYARRRHKKIGIITDNAGPLRSKVMQDYIDSTNGDVEIVYLPAHTPQLNPIEIQWREIKAAIADIFFDGLDKMRDAIIHMLHNKEIPIVKLFDWLRIT